MDLAKRFLEKMTSIFFIPLSPRGDSSSCGGSKNA